MLQYISSNKIIIKLAMRLIVNAQYTKVIVKGISFVSNEKVIVKGKSFVASEKEYILYFLTFYKLLSRIFFLLCGNHFKIISTCPTRRR